MHNVNPLQTFPPTLICKCNMQYGQPQLTAGRKITLLNKPSPDIQHGLWEGSGYPLLFCNLGDHVGTKRNVNLVKPSRF